MKCKYGIDFGTTNSSIAICYREDGEDRISIADVRETNPRETVPTLIYIDENGVTEVGEKASQAKLKRKPGVEGLLVRKIKLDLETRGEDAEYQVGSRTVPIAEMISYILRYLKEKADDMCNELGIQYSGVVMGVPVHFGDNEKAVLTNALMLAGYYKDMDQAIRETEFVSEPVAVAVQYGINLNEKKNVMVFDFGGGTLDIAIFNLKDHISQAKMHPHETIAKKRITLGGERITELFFENCIADRYGISQICQAYGIQRTGSAELLWNRLSDSDYGPEFLAAIENLKCELSNKTLVRFRTLGKLEQKPFSRDDFEDSIEDILDEITDAVDACLEEADDFDELDIDEVVLAGGSSLIPCVQELLIEKFGRSKVTVGKSSEVLTSIVRGLALLGIKKEQIIEDVVDNDYGLWDDDKDCFATVITSGMRVKDTAFDRFSLSGISLPIRAISKKVSYITITIMQHNLNGNKELKRINIHDVGSGEYKLFMSIDAARGVLIVDLYDTENRTWINIPQNQKEIRITNK